MDVAKENTGMILEKSVVVKQSTKMARKNTSGISIEFRNSNWNWKIANVDM